MGTNKQWDLIKAENNRMNFWVHALECIGDGLSDPQSLLQMATDVAVNQLLAHLGETPGEVRRRPMEILHWYLNILEKEGLVPEGGICFSDLGDGRIQMVVSQGCPYALACTLRNKKRVCKRILTFLSVIREYLVQEFDYVLIEDNPSVKCICELFPSSKARPQLFTKDQVLTLMRIFTKEMERMQEGAVEKAGRRYAQGLTGDIKSSLNQFQAAGLGKIELEQLSEEEQKAVFKGVELLQGTGIVSNRAVDEFTRGFVAGLVSRLCNVEVNCEEIECVAKGDSACRFVVTPARSIDKIELHYLKRVPLRLGLFPSMDHLTLAVANELLFSKNTQIEVNLKQYSYRRELVQAMTDGDLDGGFLTIPAILSLWQQGVLFKIVCLGHRRGSGLAVSSELASQLEVLNREPATMLLATPDKVGMESLLLYKWLRQKKFSCRTISIPSPNMLINLQNAEIDGYFCSEPYLSIVEREGVGKVLVESQEIWPDHACCALVINQGFVNQHPEAVEELREKMGIAADIIENDRFWASSIATRYFNVSDEVAHNCLLGNRQRISYTDLKPREEELEVIQKLALETGMISEKISVSDLLI